MSAIWKRPGVLLGGAGIYLGTTAVAYLTFYEPKQDDSLEEISDAKRLQVFNANANQYDKGERPARSISIDPFRCRKRCLTLAWYA